MSKINKALDLNKLRFEQTQGKLLNKQLIFPLISPIKYDGNYVVVEVINTKVKFTTSGGLNYTHTDRGGDIFNMVIDGYYLAERIYDKGLLGQRFKCNLTGPKKDQKSTGHTYKVFDYLSIDDYRSGKTRLPYYQRQVSLNSSGIPKDKIASLTILENIKELENYFLQATENGYEGIMVINPDWCWTDTTSRKVDFCKYKKRPTADLKCIDTELGEGKYTGLIGALVLEDSEGRIVRVGSGLSDELRNYHEDYFIGKIIEVEYEQLKDTYIQPVFLGIRQDKDTSD
jgi:ATP-dependent DNA ligase